MESESLDRFMLGCFLYRLDPRVLSWLYGYFGYFFLVHGVLAVESDSFVDSSSVE